MPLFEYTCQPCKLTFEKLLKQPQETADCPQCGEAAKRKVSVFASGAEGSCAAPSGSGFR
ncbi:MAG: zinc ribbon domain-containing protein [Desulfuromonas sp.]|nr:MAG: zinc ribbon domain-containing protein [Desulfuromonas sp.]